MARLRAPLALQRIVPSGRAQVGQPVMLVRLVIPGRPTLPCSLSPVLVPARSVPESRGGSEARGRRRRRVRRGRRRSSGRRAEGRQMVLRRGGRSRRRAGVAWRTRSLDEQLGLLLLGQVLAVRRSVVGGRGMGRQFAVVEWRVVVLDGRRHARQRSRRGRACGRELVL